MNHIRVLYGMNPLTGNTGINYKKPNNKNIIYYVRSN